MILGIVGSPRKGCLTDQLVAQALEGAGTTGAETKKVYLTDYKIPFYTEQTKECAEKLSALCEEADALVIGAPVYWGDINGLTKDFMDTVRISNANGKYCVGVSIAGGTGKGLCLAVQSIYSFFYHRQLRGVDPTPVSRFNFQQALGGLRASGRRLAGLSKERRPFGDLRDRIEYYEGIEYLNYTFLDEMLLLAEQLINISKGKAALQEAEAEYEIARSLVSQGRRREAVEHAVEAYDTLYF